MIKLYSLVFPQVETSLTEELYFRNLDARHRVQFMGKEQALLFENGAHVGFDTYFNSFSLEKWRKYTRIDNLFLKLKIKGKFLFTLCGYRMVYREIVRTVFHVSEITARTTQTVQFGIPIDDPRGIIAFSLQSLSDGSALYGGGFYTDCPETSLNDVNLAICMCTYHREGYFVNNVRLLQERVLTNADSPLKDHLEIYAVDNGQTLPVEELSSEKVHIFPQDAYGGSGGFVRGVIEILNNVKEKKHTHILFMDDDVVIQSEGLVKTYSLLRLMRKEYLGRQIGGAMLRSDFCFIQYESSGIFTGVDVRQVKGHRDLRQLWFVIDNEKEEYREYQAWFFSCVPINTYLRLGFSLPIFLRGDDIDYGLRLGPSITLNGICVWHQVFESKTGVAYLYLTIRNIFIVGVIHSKLNRKKMLNYLCELTKNYLFCYQYRDVKAVFKATRDFLKGVDWLEQVDARSLYKELCASEYMSKNLEEINIPFTFERLFASMDQRESKLRRFFRRAFLNGWFFPANRDVVVSATRRRILNFYRAKRVLFYDDYSGKAFESSKDYKEFFLVIYEFIKLYFLVLIRFEKVSKDFRLREKELRDRKRWERYLNIGIKERS